MNILIVGNGFDLSHYLPTKYEHFIRAMETIEKWNEEDGDMGFDDIFGALYEKEGYFFSYTKAMYLTDDIILSVQKIKNLKKQLGENIWYSYFSHHLTEIDTWIDFEMEFSQALDVVAEFISDVEKRYKKNDYVSKSVVSLYYEFDAAGYIKIGDSICEKLVLLKILERKALNEESPVAEIRKKYFRNENYNLDINSKLIIEDLEKSLNSFIGLFDNYLVSVVDELRPIFELNDNVLKVPFDDLKIFSFNYTNTIKNLYFEKPKIDFLHGKINNSNKLVLGVSDIKNDFLRKFNNYSFTKYHQKLLKNTDYLFLLENDDIKFMIDTNLSGVRSVNISIWGHSLADSDENYVEEIFKLNNKDNLECIVTIYYYKNDVSKLLNNLLGILKKEKVEKWMKKGWLKFEENPDIAKLNGIEPVDLPKISAS